MGEKRHKVFLISITIILVLVTVLIVALLVTFFFKALKPENQIEQKDICGANNTEGTVWSGLGMGVFYPQVEIYLDSLLAHGFTGLRIDIPDYQDTMWVETSKAAVVKSVSNGVKVVWGISSNSLNNPAHTITASNWPAFRQAILENALWAQNNGVYEFQLGNEECYHNDDTTMTDDQLRENIRSVAAEVQAIFTNGNISYSCAQEHIPQWISEGKGDLDIIASNIYKGGLNSPYDLSYQTGIQDMINRFGVQGFYITEFGPSYTSLTHYSSEEAVQAEAVKEMIEFIKASGLTRAFFFTLQDDRLGIVRENGTCRALIWDTLIGSGISEIAE